MTAISSEFGSCMGGLDGFGGSSQSWEVLSPQGRSLSTISVSDGARALEQRAGGSPERLESGGDVGGRPVRWYTATSSTRAASSQCAPTSVAV